MVQIMHSTSLGRLCYLKLFLFRFWTLSYCGIDVQHRMIRST